MKVLLSIFLSNAFLDVAPRTIINNESSGAWSGTGASSFITDTQGEGVKDEEFASCYPKQRDAVFRLAACLLTKRVTFNAFCIF